MSCWAEGFAVRMNLAAKLLIVQPKSLCRCLRACRRLNTVFLLREGFDCGYGRIVPTVPAGYWSPLTLLAETAATTSISIRKSGRTRPGITPSMKAGLWVMNLLRTST